MEESHHEDNTRVLIAEPGKKVYAKEIRNDWREMQMIVGGLIQAVYPSRKDAIAVVCNDEGKLMGLAPNCLLSDDSGKPYDMLVGTFFVCGVKEDNFISLSPELEKKYADIICRDRLLPVVAVKRKTHRHHEQER